MEHAHARTSTDGHGTDATDPQQTPEPPSYADLHASLPALTRRFIEQQARIADDRTLAGTTWYAIEQATGQPRDWVEGYLAWVAVHLPPVIPMDVGTETTTESSLRTDEVPAFDGEVTVDAHGWKEYHGTFQGSRFPDKPYKDDLKVELNDAIKDEYLDAIDRELPGIPTGMKLFMTCMTRMEKFAPGSKSYATHNPGNIGNTDNGKTNPQVDLDAGVRLQYDYLLAVARGENEHYPIGDTVDLAPYFSTEIDEHPENYQRSGYVPGYEFVYTGQLDQFIKIYATGARSGNTYINTIVSYFKQHGIDIAPESKLSEIIAIP